MRKATLGPMLDSTFTFEGFGNMSSSLGTELKFNLMAGQPTRTKDYNDYTAASIPVCGEHANLDGHIPPPPWEVMKSSCSSNLNDSLHDEIVSFMQYMEPTPLEKSLRADLVARFTKLIESFDMDASVRPVGSYVTGLYLPTSDIDMVLTFAVAEAAESECEFSALFDFINGCNPAARSDLYVVLARIQSSGFASKVDSVFNASVPLIRLTDRKTGIQIDLTEADTQGMKATQAVQKWMKDDMELVKTLITVLKMFLAVRRCGTTYTGGINSYVLVWMVIAWVQLELPTVQRKVDVPTQAVGSDGLSSSVALQGLSTQQTPTTRTTASSVGSVGSKIDFGHALKGILKFYGEDFDYYNVAIVIEPKPEYRTKVYALTQEYLLSIFDPAGGGEDMGRKAYAIKHIQASFKGAYDTIARLERREEDSNVGLLGKVLGADFRNFVERRENWKLVKEYNV